MVRGSRSQFAVTELQQRLDSTISALEVSSRPPTFLSQQHLFFCIAEHDATTVAKETTGLLGEGDFCLCPEWPLKPLASVFIHFLEFCSYCLIVPIVPI